MKERPIIFSGESVRATLEWRKTQTRRGIKLRDFRPCDNVPGSDWYFRAKNGIWSDVSTKRLLERYCPYGKPGDRLWVRETLAAADDQYQGLSYAYCADGKGVMPQKQWDKFSTDIISPIFMPRWASRITLEIVNIRVERVQDISEEDAEKEGMIYYGETLCEPTPKEKYSKLWDSLNSKRGYSWDSNPWVWVIEFKRIEP